MNNKLKKTLIKHLPYLFIALFATKLGQMWRLTSGNELGEKILNLGRRILHRTTVPASELSSV